MGSSNADLCSFAQTLVGEVLVGQGGRGGDLKLSQCSKFYYQNSSKLRAGDLTSGPSLATSSLHSVTWGKSVLSLGLILPCHIIRVILPVVPPSNRLLDK